MGLRDSFRRGLEAGYQSGSDRRRARRVRRDAQLARHRQRRPWSRVQKLVVFGLALAIILFTLLAVIG